MGSAPGSAPFSVLLFPCSSGAVLCPPVAGHGDARGAPQEPGGVDEAFPQLWPLLPPSCSWGQ